MKQRSRFFLKPDTFVSQIQWSRNHRGYVFFFLISSLLETLIASVDPGMQRLASILEPTLGASGDTALWILLAMRWTALVTASGAVITFFWVMGRLIGRHTSARVWTRRMSVVLSLFFLSYSVRFFTGYSPLFHVVATMGWTWAILIAFYTIRQQFDLTALESSVILTVALVGSIGTWNIAESTMETYASVHTPPAVTRVRPGLPTH